MDDIWNAVMEIRHRQVLDAVYSHLNEKDVLKMRSVCKRWNEHTIEMCKRKSIFFNINMTNKKEADTSRRSREMDNCLSTLPEDKVAKSIISVANLTFDWGSGKRGRFRIMPNNLIAEEGHDPSYDFFFLSKYGYLVKSLKIKALNIEDMLRIFRVCTNIEALDIKVWIPRRWMGWNRIPVPDFNIVNRLQNETMILDKLHTFSLRSNVPWEFGPFLKLTAPNLRNVGLRGGTFYKNANVNPNTYFLEQLENLNTGNLHSISYVTFGLSEVSSFFDKLMQFDWSLLTRIKMDWIIVSMKTELERIKYWEFIQKLAPTLKNLYFTRGNGIPYMGGFVLPHLPNVTEATIHHSVINSPEFFQKLPALEELSLKSSANDVRLQHADSKPEVLLCGFYIQNSSMWNEGNGWTPHLTVNNIDIDICPTNFVIPTTFASMFPNLTKLHVQAVGKDALVQLQNLLNGASHWPRLQSMSMFVGDISQWSLIIAFILIGIPQANWNAAQNHVNKGELSTLKELITESPLMNRSVSTTVSGKYYSRGEGIAPAWKVLAKHLVDRYCGEKSNVTFYKLPERVWH